MKRNLVFAILLLCNSLIAQENDTISTIDDMYIDFAVPDLGAFTLLGGSPNAVSRPGNIKELSADVLNIVNNSPNISPGLAIEWAPYLTFADKSSSNLQKYQKDKYIRGLQFTFGTLQDTLGAKLAYGMKWTLIDESDPLMNNGHQDNIIKYLSSILMSSPLNPDNRSEFENGLLKFYLKVDSTLNLSKNSTKEAINDKFKFPELKDDTDEYTIVETPDYNVLLQSCIQELNKKSLDKKKFGENKLLLSELDKIIQKYISLITSSKEFEANEKNDLIRTIQGHKEQYKKDNWNKKALHIGLGHILNSSDYKWENLESNKLSLYASYAHPLTKNNNKIGMQLLIQGQGSFMYNVDSAETNRSQSIGLRCIAGGSDFRVSVEGLYRNSKLYKINDHREELRITLGIELKFSDGLWLELALGTDAEIDDFSKSTMVSLVNFKYALQTKRRYGF